MFQPNDPIQRIFIKDDSSTGGYLHEVPGQGSQIWSLTPDLYNELFSAVSMTAIETFVRKCFKLGMCLEAYLVLKKLVEKQKCKKY